MNIDELSQILSDDVSDATEKNRPVVLLLFGIRHAKYLQDGNIYNVIKHAGGRNTVINFSYDKQIEHGVELAKFVKLE